MDKSAEKPEMENAIPRRRNFRPAIFLIGIIVVAAGVFTVIMMNKKKDEPKDDSPKTENNISVVEDKTNEPEKKTEEETKKKKEETTTSENENINGKTPQNLDGKTEDSQGSLTGVVNYADVIDDTLIIRVSIDQYLEAGTCTLELTAPAVNDTFGLTDQITPSAATSSCSFDIATSLLTGGHYNIKVTVSSEGKSGLITDEVDV